MSSYIAFNLDGTFIKQDSARELMRLFPEGNHVYEIITRYDGLLTVENQPGHEPGDAGAYIIPFLLLHGVTGNDIVRIASEANQAPGAPELVSSLSTDGWRVFCVTSAYERFAIHVTHKFGIFAHNVASTTLPLDNIRISLTQPDSELIRRVETDILALKLEDDLQIKTRLDNFFREELPLTAIGKLIQQVKPVGGQRKVDALKRFSEKYAEPLTGWVAVGNSLKDTSMLSEANKAGGLAIAFNGDRHAAQSATLNVTSSRLDDLKDVLTAWKRGQHKEVRRVLQERERRLGASDPARFRWLAKT